MCNSLYIIIWNTLSFTYKWGKYFVRHCWRVWIGYPENADWSLQSSLPHCSFYMSLCLAWDTLRLTWVNGRIVLPWMLMGENAGTEECCVGIASTCCPGKMFSTDGFSGSSNDLLNSGGFCSAAAVCQDLPQFSNLGRLLRLGIM